MRLKDMDTIQMKDSSFYVGNIKNKFFTVKVGVNSRATRLKINKNQIVWITFRNNYGYQQDDIQLKDGTALDGYVQEKMIVFESESLGKVELATEDVLNIHFAPSR